ncbi:hypothetical protein KIPB_013489 [Kipferlia bialata]|uniref:Uncharacterized protein n=1 Tax=Kipferlia bialata TaxID=797122 RepID=A0A391P1G6_9EUKA|nr:hypothetical protein KIPB_013489 [Kipferlia bialata]|eukprot:g13489.t1
MPAPSDAKDGKDSKTKGVNVYVRVRPARVQGMNNTHSGPTVIRCTSDTGLAVDTGTDTRTMAFTEVGGTFSPCVGNLYTSYCLSL